ncbi:MAG: signal peptidase II [Bacteriovoracaceae bacterium]|nr:signal peptidase II [Bacteriovoracaceae bacterium]
MKKHSLRLQLLIFVSCVLFDFMSKIYVQHSHNSSFNSGLFLGLFSYIPQDLKVIVLASFAGFLFAFYIFFLITLVNKLFQIKLGLSFLLGGVFGNVLDQVIHGKTLDFIPISISGHQFYTNVADVFQWFGVLMILQFIIRKEKVIWFPNPNRKNYLVRPKEQIGFAIRLTLVSFCCSLLLGLFSFSYLKHYVPQTLINKELILAFVLSYIFLSLIFTLLVFLAGVVLSNRTSGPLYAFEMYVEDLLKGDRENLQFRDGDQYLHLEKLALKLKRKFEETDKK